MVGVGEIDLSTIHLPQISFGGIPPLDEFNIGVSKFKIRYFKYSNSYFQQPIEILEVYHNDDLDPFQQPPAEEEFPAINLLNFNDQIPEGYMFDTDEEDDYLTHLHTLLNYPI
jgi:hypothetical protein